MSDNAHWLYTAFTQDPVELFSVAAGVLSSGAAGGAWLWSRRRLKSPPINVPQPDTGIDELIRKLESDQSVWMQPVRNIIEPVQLNRGGKPIITIANLKGGVGKTTITSNIAAYLSKQNKRVLVIDFDYQGSLSTALTVAADQTDRRKRAGTAEALIRPDATTDDVVAACIDLNPTLNAALISSYYEFQNFEDRLLMSWLAGIEQADIRFSLAKHLRSQAFANFDVVLIDAPPRMTTGFINALCASTHLFVPTIMDMMSAEAVTYFAKQLHEMSETVFPKLQIAGAIPSRTKGLGNDTLDETESRVADYIDREIGKTLGTKNFVLRDAKIPNGDPFGSVAGEGIAYLGRHTEAKRRIEAMGQRIRDVVGF